MVHSTKESERDIINAELEDVFETSFDEIFITDQHGVVLRVNSMCENNYRLSADEIVGQHVSELEQKGVFYPSATQDVIKHQRPLELIQQTKFGRYLHVRARPVFDKHGKLKRVISYSRDLTEFMHLKQKIDQMEEELQNYKKELNEPLELEGFISKSNSMSKVLTLVQKVAKVDSTVLILGETGVGKSEIVRMIHQLSDRRDHVLNEINCAALPAQLIEAELFGYEGGTFTGGLREGKKGLIELSDRGTLFFDEIGELPLHTQGKLLQVLQEKRIRPVGGKQTLPVDVRIVAATNKDLEKMVAEGSFRKDLYYRLNVIPIHIPPLRERKEDILPLVYHFLESYNVTYARNIRFSPKVLAALLDYEWDGNVRELENLVERLVVTTDDTVTVMDLPVALQKKNAYTTGQSLTAMLEEVEKSIIVDAYEKYGSTYKLAQALHISQSAASRKVRKYVNDEPNH